MMKSSLAALVALAGIASLSVATLVTPAPAAGQTAHEGHISVSEMVTKRSPAIVSVKFVLKGEMGDMESECQGVIVEADGLVLVSNIQIGGLAARFGGGSVTPTELKILIGDDTQGVDASIIARDSELGLAWLKIKEPKGPYAFIDFSASKDPALGDGLFVLGQMGKFFDRVPVAMTGNVAAVTSKPRKLFIPSVTLSPAEFGLPVFDGAGNPVGVVTVILPEDDELQGPGGMERILRGVQGGKMILPGAEVVSATQKAKETAAAAPATPAEPAPAEPAPATPATPATP
jgi:S1-C subfamily serine protease